MWKKRLLPLVLLLVCSLPAAGQQRDSFWRDLNDFLDMRADKAYAKTDTTYVGRYPYHWDARLFVRSTGFHFVSTYGGDIALTTGLRNRIGIGLAWRGLGLSISHAIGEKYNLSLGLDSYGQHFCFEYALKATTALKGTIQLDSHDLHWDNVENLLLISNKLNIFYSFNPRFSYAAAMKQTKIQRRSAGSFIAAVSWAVWDILLMDEDPLQLEDFYQANYFYQRFSVGAGYGYNLVLGRQHWLLHASLVPMWSVYEMQSWRERGVKDRAHYPYGKIAYTGTARAGVYYRWGERWSVGFSGVINQMASTNHFSGKKDDFMRFGAQEWQMNLALAYRF